MNGLEKSAKKETVYMIVTVLLYAIGAASIPYNWLSDLLGGAKEWEWTFGFLTKILASILPIYLIVKFGFKNALSFKGCSILSLFLVLPAFLVMLNNFPFIPLMSGDMSINGNFLQIILYALFAFSIGVLEETTFRGCILPLCLIKFSKDKKGVFWSVIVSSLIFGSVHILNLLNGFSPAVFLQVGYSFLIGATCGFAYIVCGNIYLPIIFHGLFNFGGMMVGEGLGVGALWTTTNIVWTAITSVILCVIIVVIFVKKDFSSIYARLNILESEKTEKEDESSCSKG
jgi:membrane protease YdiL (CAAX protease family)